MRAEVAQLLGITPNGLLDARLNKVFRTHYLHGYAGKPRPVLYTDKPLDRAARGFAHTDPIWSATARDFPGRIPPGIDATLTRVPIYQPQGPDYGADTDALHPEHPDNDAAAAADRGK